MFDWLKRRIDSYEEAESAPIRAPQIDLSRFSAQEAPASAPNPDGVADGVERVELDASKLGLTLHENPVAVPASEILVQEMESISPLETEARGTDESTAPIPPATPVFVAVPDTPNLEPSESSVQEASFQTIPAPVEVQRVSAFTMEEQPPVQTQPIVDLHRSGMGSVHRLGAGEGSDSGLSRWKQPLKQGFRILQSFCLLLVLSALVHHFLIQRVEVGGDSMEPTLNHTDQILVLKNLYRVERGDVVLLSSRHLSAALQVGDLIQRVVATGGDTVEIKENRLYVNEQLVLESYLPEQTRTEPVDLRYSKVTLGPGECYVLGDHRSKSFDSRFFGPIREDDIVGELWFRLTHVSDPNAGQ